jgi:uncharacterized protein (DUF1778 family)
MKSQKPPTSRIEARIAPEALAIVRRAAEIQGRSIGDFVVAAAQDAAQKTVAGVEIIRLSREAEEQVTALLLEPPPVSDALLSAIERHRKLIVDSCGGPVLNRAAGGA